MSHSPHTVVCPSCKRRVIPESINLKTGECHACTLGEALPEVLVKRANVVMDREVVRRDFEYLFDNLPDQNAEATIDDRKRSRKKSIEDLKRKGY